jgi:long-chain fatty acid transport protein
MLGRHAKRFTFLAMLSCISLASSPAQATPQDIFGYGAVSPGLAMAGVATCTGYECVFVNPAGLSRSETTAIYLGLHAGGISLTLDEERFPFDSARASTIGFQLRLPFGGALENRIAMGAAFYTPQDTILRNDVLFVEVPQFVMLSRAHVVAIQLGAGIDLDGWVDGFRLGFGVSALANTGGQLSVRVDASDRFVSETETQLLAGFAPIIGVTWESDELTLGAVYRSELRSEINLDIEVSGLPVALPLLTISALAQYDPHTIALEGAWQVNEGLRLTANLTTRLWSLWPGLHGKTSMSSNMTPDPEFNNTFSPRLAVERVWSRDGTRLSARGGYVYEPTPAPVAAMRQMRTSNGEPLQSGGEPTLVPVRLLDNDRHILTAGGGVDWRTSDGWAFDFDLYAQLHMMPERAHDIAAPDSTTPMTTSGWILAGGWTMGVGW